MDVRTALITGIQKLTVRWLLKGPGSSVIVAGTLTLAGLGAAALTHPAGTSAPVGPSASTPAPVPSAYGCFYDPDGDGTIKCSSSVVIAKLPAAWGQCHANLYGDGLTVCDGTDH